MQIISKKALIFMRISVLREKFKFYFLIVFASIDQMFTLAGRLCTGLSLYGV